jgi:rubredoxin
MNQWLEQRQVSVAYGLSSAEAAKILDLAPGEWWNKIYHSCAECPVGAVPKEKRGMIDDEWTCPYCEREGIEDELVFEQFKLLPEGSDRDKIVRDLLGNDPD